ncbi:YihY/virulence factor BrkB family protein [Liquorilactobacillus mali]|uniref:YihY/virulence factor BrkB family protein n=1 Tax=Liquorilactobacillus mali TaxID=1618 RepID=UPI000977A9CA|nr:YihY/virulence factor BrkB family protein [Liquorilactobacillus mali]MDC7953083.1 YihY/virulence factor BrkB family protein [Liquorilactobacillus mali]
MKEVVKDSVKRSSSININNTSIVIAYYSLLAIFPSIILIGNTLPLLNIKAATVLMYLESAVPATIYKTLNPIIISFLERSSGGLISVSALVALWATSRGVNALKLAFNEAYGVEESQNAITARIISFFLTLIFIFLMIAIILLFSFGQTILDYLTPIFQLPRELGNIFSTLRWPVTLLGLFFIISLIYYFLPNAKLHLHLIIPGAVIATLGWIALAQGFSIYVRYFAKSVLSYGTIGTFIVLLFWLNYSGWIIMIGAVLNASLEKYFYKEIRVKKAKLKEYIKKKVES